MDEIPSRGCELFALSPPSLGRGRLMPLDFPRSARTQVDRPEAYCFLLNAHLQSANSELRSVFLLPSFFFPPCLLSLTFPLPSPRR